VDEASGDPTMGGSVIVSVIFGDKFAQEIIKFEGANS
jgi:hypothetical protein